MAKTFPIKLEVEEIALGAVLRKLNDMPGIAKLDLDLGHGGTGKGKEQIQADAAAMRSGKEEALIKLLANGPNTTRIMRDTLHLNGSRMHYLLGKLSKARIVKNIGRGEWQLTMMPSAHHGPVLALPPPPKIKRGPSGRASPGSGPILLRSVLEAGPLSPNVLLDKLAAGGIARKAAHGVVRRGKDDGLIKRNGQGYVLTAKGRHVEGAAHG